MNGADLLIKTAVKAGIDVCFSNPGTTEMPIVNALDNVPGIRAILGLFEGVCTGAADGYARMLNKPAMTLLHLGPGFGNGIANLHNAKRAKTPMFNVVGEHASWHLPHDPLLAMDIEALAGSVSGWHHTIKNAANVLSDTIEAITNAGKGKIATLIVPNDFQLADLEEQDIVIPQLKNTPASMQSIEQAVNLLLQKKRTALILGGKATSKDGLMTIARIQSKIQCDLFYETFPARLEQGAGYPNISRIPYLPEMAIDVLKPYEVVICIGTREPVAFFGYTGLPSRFTTDRQEKLVIDPDDNTVTESLSAIADAVNAPKQPDSEILSRLQRPAVPTGSLDGAKAGEIIAALQPEHAIVVEEAITNSLVYHSVTNGCPPFTLLALTGGAIGQGPACATGAAVACPDRPVIDFQADGSAMYTVQSLWTQARENLNVTTIICSNRSYDILKLEMARSGNVNPGENANRMTDLTGIDWVKMGQAHGVPSVSVKTCDALVKELGNALTEDGPHLIELQL